MRFIVTGGAGFIGSSFIEKALESNHQVIAIDNLSSGRIENIEPFQKHRNFSFLHHDLSASFPRELINLPKAEGFICHFAAQVGVESVVRGVSESIRNNIHVSEQVVKFSSDHEIPVLFTSSSEIYGKSQSIPTSEHDDRIMGSGSVYRWAYAETKILDELLFKELWQLKKIPTISVRLFNTVGPRQSADYGMVIPRFVKQALSGESITVYGDGSQRRTFCSVSDVVTAIFELIQNESSHGEVFNVGSTNSVTILELAQKIRAKVGSDSPIVFVNANEKLGLGFEEIDNRCPDIEKITSLVGWTPKKSLDDIIKEVILYTQKN